MKNLSRRNMLKAVGLGAAALAGGPLISRSLAQEAPAAEKLGKLITLTIYNTGDMHDHAGNLPRVAGFVKAHKAKDPNVLLVDAGDVWNDGERRAPGGGIAMVHLMQLAGYDAATCGNHDYIGGIDRILQTANKYPGWNLTLANVNWEQDQIEQAKVIPQYRLFKLEGLTLSVSGGACQYFNHCYGRKPVLIHERDGYVRVRPKFKDHADVHLFISHLWDAYDRRMIMRWGPENSPDVIVGGHTHGRTIWKQANVHIIKAGFWGTCLGKTVLSWDPQAKKIVGCKQGFVNVANDWPVDKEVQSALDEYSNPARK